jgi:trans-2-enoyl-CoA reductase
MSKKVRNKVTAEKMRKKVVNMKIAAMKKVDLFLYRLHNKLFQAETCQENKTSFLQQE